MRVWFFGGEQILDSESRMVYLLRIAADGRDIAGAVNVEHEEEERTNCSDGMKNILDPCPWIGCSRLGDD